MVLRSAGRSEAGRWRHDARQIHSRDDARLSQTCEGRTFPLEPYDGETLATRFKSTENSLLHLPMTFVSDAEARVVAVNVPLIPGIAPQRFVRQ